MPELPHLLNFLRCPWNLVSEVLAHTTHVFVFEKKIWVIRPFISLCIINSYTLSYFPCCCKPSLIRRLYCRNMTLVKEIFPAATDSRFIRAVSIWRGYLRILYNLWKEFLTFLSPDLSWVSLPSAFPPWTGLRFCCTITTSIWTSKSSWKASACMRGSSQL